MDFLKILLYTHSGLRWLIVLAALLALAVFGYGWLARKTFPKLARILPAAYSGLLDTQTLLGFIYFFWTGLAGAGFPRYRIEHLSMMFLAAILGHLPSRWKKTEDSLRYRNIFFVVIGTLILIYLGVAVLPGGWNR